MPWPPSLGVSPEETNKHALQKDQAEVVQDKIYCVGGPWRLPQLPSFPFALLQPYLSSSLPLFFLM